MKRFNAVLSNGKGLPYSVRVLARDDNEAYCILERNKLTGELIQILPVFGIETGNYEYSIN